MQELNQFCHKYLPEYFASKYSECKLKEHFFNFSNEGNVYELTGKNFALLDKLLTANRDLEASKIIEKSFIFTILEFKKYREQIKDVPENKEPQCKTRQTVRLILKTMQEKHRMCFQIFMRLAYFYFQTKENEYRIKKNKLLRKAATKRQDFEDQIVAFFMDMKFLSMTEDDSFNPSAFLEYCIRILLGINPNSEFFVFINKVMDNCELGEIYRERVNNKINTIKSSRWMEQIKNQSKKTPLKKQSSNCESSILEPKNQNIPQQPVVSKLGEQTPLKTKSSTKSERKTHETSQKKEYIDNKKEEEPNILDVLKKSLEMHKNKSVKERTIYSRKTYVIPKKLVMADQASSTASNQNNNNQELFLLDFNRSFSSRYLDFNNDQNEDQDDDFLAGATPKPKKKVKIDKTYTGTFDQNGNFVKGLFERGI